MSDGFQNGSVLVFLKLVTVYRRVCVPVLRVNSRVMCNVYVGVASLKTLYTVAALCSGLGPDGPDKPNPAFGSVSPAVVKDDCRKTPREIDSAIAHNLTSGRRRKARWALKYF